MENKTKTAGKSAQDIITETIISDIRKEELLELFYEEQFRIRQADKNITKCLKKWR